MTYNKFIAYRSVAVFRAENVLMNTAAAASMGTANKRNALSTPPLFEI